VGGNIPLTNCCFRKSSRKDINMKTIALHNDSKNEAQIKKEINRIGKREYLLKTLNTVKKLETDLRYLHEYLDELSFGEIDNECPEKDDSIFNVIISDVKALQETYKQGGENNINFEHLCLSLRDAHMAVIGLENIRERLAWITYLLKTESESVLKSLNIEND
jgi:hypothetical protein